MLKDKLIDDFLNELASSSSSPGGGAASALVAAISTSLCSMMANLTINKKGYEKIWYSADEVVERMEKRKEDFLILMDKDAKSFDGVINAFKLPKDTKEEKDFRTQQIQEGYKEAIKVPIEIARKTLELFDDIDYIVTKGNKNVITDGIAAAMAARTAINMALLNAKVNLKSVKSSTLKDERYIKATKSDIIDIEVAAAGYLAKICSKSGLQF